MLNCNFLPKKHLEVLMNLFKGVRAFQIELNVGLLVLEERGKPEFPEENLSSKGENQHQTQPTSDVDTGI